MKTIKINSYEILQGSPELARLRRRSSGVGLQQKEEGCRPWIYGVAAPNRNRFSVL